MRRATRVLFTTVRGSTTIVVRECDGWRELAFIAGGSAFVHTRVFRAQPRRSGWPYIDGFHLAVLLAPEAKRALFIGCGGGIGPSQFLRTYPSMKVDVVELEPTVVELAKRFFGLEPDARLRVYVEDAVTFLEKQGDAYDLIVLDAYDDGSILPALSSTAFFGCVRTRLSEAGILCVNVIGATAGAQSRPLRGLLKALSAAFDGEAFALFAIRGLSEGVQSTNTEVRRNHLAWVTRGRSRFPLGELQRRACQLTLPDAPLAASAASWPVEFTDEAAARE